MRREADRGSAQHRGMSKARCGLTFIERRRTIQRAGHDDQAYNKDIADFEHFLVPTIIGLVMYSFDIILQFNERFIHYNLGKTIVLERVEISTLHY